jgi:hypothetical protein
MIAISATHNNARLQATLDFLVLGSQRPKVSIYGNTRPSTGASPGAVALVEIELNPASAAISNGALSIQQFAPGLIMATGSAAWARIVNGNGAHVLDCDASGPGGLTEIVVSAETLYLGGRVLLVSAVFG